MFLLAMLNNKRLSGMKRNNNTEFEKINHEAGIRDLPHNGNCDIAGARGTSIAIAISAFASAPPKIRRSWKRTYTRAIIIGMKMR